MDRPAALEYGYVCDTGDIRPENQDSVLADIRQQGRETQGIFLVADGMGGASCGRQAGQTAARVMEDWWRHTVSLQDARDSVDDALRTAQEKVLEISRQVGKTVGTTLSLLLILGDGYIIRHVGDSRVYRLCSDGFVQLTPDHSYVAEQVKAGRMLPEEAKVHPKRNLLTQCLGTRRTPDVFKCDGMLEQTHVFMLCSDGFYGAAEESEAAALFFSMGEGTTLQKKAESFRDLIKAGKAHDNVSIILVRTEKVDACGL